MSSYLSYHYQKQMGRPKYRQGLGKLVKMSGLDQKNLKMSKVDGTLDWETLLVGGGWFSFSPDGWDSYNFFQARNTGLPGMSYPSSIRRLYLVFVGVSSVLSRASKAARLGSEGMERVCEEEDAFPDE